jgi:inner membrane protein
LDNICHTLTGAALGHAGLASRTRYGMATLMAAANLPDIDVAVFFTDTLPMSFRRGWTHGVLAQIALPILLAALMWLVGRASARQRPDAPGAIRAPGAPWALRAPELRFTQLLLLSYIGLYSHIVMDLLNSYGLRILMPFSGRWFYGDALYIIDPWMWVVLGAGVFLSSAARDRGALAASRPARWALVAISVYAAVMFASNLWARAVVSDGLARAGRPADTRFMVTPVFANPFRREVLVDLGQRYEKGMLWFEPMPRFRPAGYGVDKGLDSPEAARALATPRAESYLGWSRFPFVVIDRSVGPPRLILNDYRYSDTTGRVGWAGLSVPIEPRAP